MDSTTFLEKRDDPGAWDILVAVQNAKPEPSSMIYFTPTFAGWTNSPELTDAIASYRSSPDLDTAVGAYSGILTAFQDYRPLTKVGDVNSPYAARSGIGKIPMMDGPILWAVR